VTLGILGGVRGVGYPGGSPGGTYFSVPGFSSTKCFISSLACRSPSSSANG